MNRELFDRILADEIELPPIPVAWSQIVELFRDSDADVADLARALSQDLSLTARILRLANSAQYAPREQILSVEKAAVVLGVRTLRNLTLQVSLVHDYQHLSGNGVLDLDDFWRHCTLTAELAQRIAEACTSYRGPDPADLYTCGLLHDMGVLVLLDNRTDAYLDVLRAAKDEGLELHAAEHDALGYTHMEVGALLSTRWKLPKEITNAIRHHHRAEKAASADHGLAVVDVANRAASALMELEPPPGWTLVEPRTAKRLGLSVPALEGLMESVRQR